MLAQTLPHFRRWLNAVLTRTLTLSEALIVGCVLLTVGTIYCQIYCLLALQQMHGVTMPVLASVHRASVDIVPAFAAFEMSKRIPMQGRLWQWIVIALIFVGAIAAAVAWRLQLDAMTMGLTPRRMAVDRIPFMALAAGALVYFHWRQRRPEVRLPWARASDDPEKLPPPKAIDWVKAAGNYVEVRVGDRTLLMRMTMRQIAGLLPQDEFVQIHRSVIVSRDRIAKVNGRRSVELADGTKFSVGDAYRVNLTAH